MKYNRNEWISFGFQVWDGNMPCYWRPVEPLLWSTILADPGAGRGPRPRWPMSLSKRSGARVRSEQQGDK